MAPVRLVGLAVGVAWAACVLAPASGAGVGRDEHGDHGHDVHDHGHEHGHGDEEDHDHGHDRHGGHERGAVPGRPKHGEHHHDHHGEHHQDHGGDEHHGKHSGEHKHGHGHGHEQHDSHGHWRQRTPKAAAAPPNWKGAYAAALAMSMVSFVGVALLGLLQMPALGAVIEYTCLAFAGAVLIADALLHLLPHALEGADHDEMSAVGISGVAGAFSLLVVPELCEWHKHRHGHEIEAAGVANLVVEMLHNFVDGIAIGLSFIAGPTAGLEASLAVAAHELPQELGDFMVLRAAGFAVPRLLMWNFVASLTCVLGVGVAHYIGQEASALLQKHLMSFTAGSFLTLALSMIYPQVMASIRAYHTGPGRARAKLLCLSVSVVAVVVLLKVGNLEAGHSHGHHEGHDHGHAGHSHGEF